MPDATPDLAALAGVCEGCPPLGYPTDATRCTPCPRRGFVLKRYEVSIQGYGTETYETSSRGKALAQAYRADIFEGLTFKEFLKLSRCSLADKSSRFGDPITVGGRPAFFVSNNRQYVRFVRPGSDVVMNSHPYDVEPKQYRPDTYRSREYLQDQEREQ